MFTPKVFAVRQSCRAPVSDISNAGVVIQAPAWMADDTAMNAVFNPSDTLDVDYGLLLSQFYGKWLASPTGLDVFSSRGSVILRAA
jgi:hypothetical protein